MRAVVHHGPRRWSRNVWFQSGDVIIREGDLVTETSSVYMIEEGEVSIEIDDDVVAVRRKTYCGEITKVGKCGNARWLELECPPHTNTY